MIEQVADLLGKQRPEVRELFRYALVLAMIDDEKARVIGTRVEEQREWLTVETVAADVFDCAPANFGASRGAVEEVG